MPLIELPRALEEYFAFAETEPTRRGRRFSITLPVFNGARLERLQWWYHVSPGQEQMFDGHGLAFLRADAVKRFTRHIERWLEINRQRLHGDEPIPRVTALPTPEVFQDALQDLTPDPAMAAALEAALDAARAKTDPTPPHSAEILPWPLERIANG
jgi:hypothetical protein